MEACGCSCSAAAEHLSLLLILSGADGLCAGWGVPGLLIPVGKWCRDLALRLPTLASGWSEDVCLDEAITWERGQSLSQADAKQPLGLPTASPGGVSRIPNHSLTPV